MRARARRGAGALVALGTVVALGILTRVPYGEDPGPGARIRLSWRAVGERVEACRVRSPEELAALPRHMRRERVCEGRLASYALEAVVDGRRVVADTVRGSGVRGDRPLYVFRELPVRPGVHRVRVSFRRLGEGNGSGGEEVIPPSLLLEAMVRVGPGEVALITYDPGARRLRVGPREG